SPGNNGPIVSGDGNNGWQMRDQNTTGAGNLPQLQYAFSSTVADDMHTNGFTLTFVIENVASSGGIWFGTDGARFGSGADARVQVVNNGLVANDNDEHTVTLTWDGTNLSRTIDGGSATNISLANNGDNNYTGADNGSAMFLVDSGSSNGTSAGWNIISAELNVVPEPSSSALLGLGGLALILRRRK
ncbi:MAG: PEP-CTERM sorting domain-containing protein, partial [Akkermansiaceae bacterium]